MSRNVRVPSLWDVETVIRFPPVREMNVAAVSTRDVDEFCHRYHYTDTAGNQTWRWGLWFGPMLLGIVAYNLPTPTVCESVFGAANQEHVWHMGRLALADAAPKNCESRLIGGSLRAIQKDYQSVWGILTYAATDAGHIGYVYQATNALYTGLGGKTTYFTDRSGARRGGHLHGHVSEQRATEMGWVRHSGGLKHRYIYVLGNARQRHERMTLLQYPVLPYPKAASNETGLAQ